MAQRAFVHRRKDEGFCFEFSYVVFEGGTSFVLRPTQWRSCACSYEGARRPLGRAAVDHGLRQDDDHHAGHRAFTQGMVGFAPFWGPFASSSVLCFPGPWACTRFLHATLCLVMPRTAHTRVVAPAASTREHTW